MKMIIANFKSNKNKVEMEEWVRGFSESSAQYSGSVVLCPPMPHLYTCTSLIQNNVFLGVQDLSSYPAGSYTGAVSTHNLDGFGVKYAIVGHSERRSHFHETNADIANKVKECVAAGITPIVCVSKDEVNATANALDENDRKRCIVAFEPLEHIGTGEADTLEHILETKKWVHIAFGSVPYLYGGSVNVSTDTSILTSPEIDGFLVGGASLDAQGFLSLLSRIK